MALYKPLNDPVPSDVIGAVYSGEYEDGTPAAHPLTDSERELIDRGRLRVESGLTKKKIEYVKENTGVDITDSRAKRKTMFGPKSGEELFAMLGVLFTKLEKEDPDVWNRFMRWARSGNPDSDLKRLLDFAKDLPT